MLTIRTNNVPRFTIDDFDLAPKERAEFDWLDWKAVDAGEASYTFFRFKRRLYLLSEFMRVDTDEFKGWDGIHTDSAFSGVLVRLDGTGDKVTVGQYFS